MYRKENVYNKILNAGSGNPTTVKKIIYSIQRLVKEVAPSLEKYFLRKDEPLKLYPDLKYI